VNCRRGRCCWEIDCSTEPVPIRSFRALWGKITLLLTATHSHFQVVHMSARTASSAIWKGTRISLNIQDDGGFPAAIGLHEREAMQRHRFHIHPHAVTAGINGLANRRGEEGVWWVVVGYA